MHCAMRCTTKCVKNIIKHTLFSQYIGVIHTHTHTHTHTHVRIGVHKDIGSTMKRKSKKNCVVSHQFKKKIHVKI